VVVATLYGVFNAKLKLKIGQVYMLGKESVDLARVSVEALEDNKITKDEVALIKKEAEEVRTAWKTLLGK